MEHDPQLTEILQRLTALAADHRRRITQMEENVNIFEGGKSSPPAKVAPAEGSLQRILQLLHATAQAGWWQTPDGKKASFAQVAEQILEPMGVTMGNIRCSSRKSSPC